MKALKDMTIEEKKAEYKKDLARALALGCTKAQVREYVEGCIRSADEEDDRSDADIALEAISAFIIMTEVAKEEEEEEEDYGPSLHQAMARDNEAAADSSCDYDYEP